MQHLPGCSGACDGLRAWAGVAQALTNAVNGAGGFAAFAALRFAAPIDQISVKMVIPNVRRRQPLYASDDNDRGRQWSAGGGLERRMHEKLRGSSIYGIENVQLSDGCSLHAHKQGGNCTAGSGNHTSWGERIGEIIYLERDPLGDPLRVSQRQRG